ncbi:tyrosine-type recombinase/integrase [Novosphingobium naphthalenivorans]|uniref:tyrosine-type recombinase/integrase n=1 Tax=Novosphingobium naphthalenivorans TaxID=273168 RepID=UPI0008311770|nr:tyrosine-type recombinase/integrase [Novosphingobium naphthalenivorans]
MTAYDEPTIIDLFDLHGQRKYLNTQEARRFLAAANKAATPERLFCLVLFYTGARISEVLELNPRRLDVSDRRIIFRTLKRRKLSYRAVPVPTRLIRELNALARPLGQDDRLFPFCRQTGWRIIKNIMERARIDGPQATPRGLRHQFGIHAIEVQVPESLLQRWMGHARARTTRVYTVFGGGEERRLAKRMWQESYRNLS